MSEEQEIQFNSIDEALDFAITKEKEAFSFYKDWSGKVDSEEISKVLDEFSSEELKHKRILERAKEGEFAKVEPDNIPDLKLADHFVRPIPSGSMDFEEAMRIAIAREGESIKLYEHLAGIQKTQTLKDVFRSLKAEEKKHKLKLESIYDDTFMKED